MINYTAKCIIKPIFCYLPIISSRFMASIPKFNPGVDYYKTLGLKNTATESEIKKAYFQLAKKYHPDVNKTASAEKFKEISEAYHILSDNSIRKDYDAARSGNFSYTQNPYTKSHSYNEYNNPGQKYSKNYNNNSYQYYYYEGPKKSTKGYDKWKFYEDIFRDFEKSQYQNTDPRNKKSKSHQYFYKGNNFDENEDYYENVRRKNKRNDYYRNYDNQYYEDNFNDPWGPLKVQWEEFANNRDVFL